MPINAAGILTISSEDEMLKKRAHCAKDTSESISLAEEYKKIEKVLELFYQIFVVSIFCWTLEHSC